MDLYPLFNSIRIALISTVVIFFVGIFAAYYIAKLPRVIKGILDVILTLPLVQWISRFLTGASMSAPPAEYCSAFAYWVPIALNTPLRPTTTARIRITAQTVSAVENVFLLFISASLDSLILQL